MKFPAGTIIEDHVGMGFDKCTCTQNTLRPGVWAVSEFCVVHCTDDTLARVNFDDVKPVQLTVGATYYEKSMIGDMPTFMHYQCACENVDWDSQRKDNVFKVVSGCRMHDPASNYQGNSFPVAKTVMK